MRTKLVWNKELKILTAGLAVIVSVSLLVLNLGFGLYGMQMRRDYKELLAAIFGNVVSAYPDVSEEELISVISGEGKEEKELGEKLLTRYGIFQEYGMESFIRQESGIRFLTFFMNLCLLLFFLTLGVLLLCYLKKRQQKISGLESYMEALNREEYKLAIEDNGEDELSGLRNEIYKLTVMLKEQARRAREQKQALADSVADISHQLKTPLTSMTVLIDDLAEDQDMDPAVRRHFLSEIAYQLTGMSWLITAMLKISKLDAGMVELEQDRISVAALVEETLQKVEVAAEWKEVTFSLGIGPGTEVVGDKRWTVEALANIVKNAVEHSARGGSVKITAEENDIYTRIDIRDFGEGITEEQREKLFRRFYNGPYAGEDSMGLGLALAKEIIEKQNGSISVDSVPGKGTRFTIKFLK